jgi:Phosphotransferase enzyme family
VTGPPPDGEEVPLSDGEPSVAGSVLIDGQVHRQTGPWTLSVHALLDHLEAEGFDGAPRVVGFDEAGREVLTWVEGVSPVMPWPGWMQTDEALVGLGGLLRRYHEAVKSFRPPPGSEWRRWIGSPGGPIIRHGDLWPSNVVFRSGLPVALIDWEFAQPGTALDDIASAAKQWVPLMGDGQAEQNGWTLPVDRAGRLDLLCSSYGLPKEARARLLSTVVANSDYGYRSHKTWGEAGVPGFAQMWKAGSGDRILADRAWLAANLDALQDALLSGP